jgi:hypothetical protein
VLLFATTGGGPLRIATPRGLNFVHRNSPTSQKYLIEAMGGGVALLDYNNDGLLDIFLVNSGRLDDPVKAPQFSRAAPAYWNRLYRQNRDGSFTDVTAQAGLAAADGWSASAGFFDYDNDGKLDLFVIRYLDWNVAQNILCGANFRIYCRPDKFGAVASILYHNNGDGTFSDVSHESGIAAVPGKSLGVAILFEKVQDQITPATYQKGKSPVDARAAGGLWEACWWRASCWA